MSDGFGGASSSGAADVTVRELSSAAGTTLGGTGRGGIGGATVSGVCSGSISRSGMTSGAVDVCAEAGDSASAGGITAAGALVDVG